VRLVSNPVVMRMVGLFLVSGFAFLLGMTFIRRMRRSLTEESTLGGGSTPGESLPLHTYHAVIQQLKQQKHELQSLQLVERKRAKSTENISAAVLSHLSSGVMFFAATGLVRQANAAAKRILGFASPVGMSAVEIFRQATVAASSGPGGSSPGGTVTEAVHAGVRENTASGMELEYVTPSGEKRFLEITITPVNSSSGDALGAACLINDKTEVTLIQQQQELRGEISAEMALKLRSSLTTISGYAGQLAVSHDLEQARQIAADIASEAAHLNHTIGGFLSGPRPVKAAAGA
jgi:nitrogen fixation/metabolism regulation signal transduction histidine kinase